MGMYVWNTTKLASDLKADAVSERDKRNYLIAGSVLVSLSIYLAPMDGVEPNQLVLIEAVVAILITIVGIAICHDVNDGGDKRAFLDRFVCMSFPLMIRLLALGIAIVIPVAVVFALVDPAAFDQYAEGGSYTAADVLGSLGFQVLFYWRMKLHLARIAGARAESTASAG